MHLKDMLEEDQLDELMIWIEMIPEIAKEANITFLSAIEVLSFYYNENYFSLRNKIRDLMPEWFLPNCQVGYLDDKPLKRVTLGNAYTKVNKKLCDKIRRLYKCDELTVNEELAISNHILNKYKPSIFNLGLVPKVKTKDFYLNIELVEDGAKMPTRAHPTDAGLDVYATSDFNVGKYSDIVHSLGFKVEFPKGYYLQIVDKSGRSVNNRLMVGAGTIDSGYRGIVKVHLFQLSDSHSVIKKGEKIAQIVVHKCWTGLPKQVEHIEENTMRGTGGFGSTGLN